MESVEIFRGLFYHFEEEKIQLGKKILKTCQGYFDFHTWKLRIKIDSFLHGSAIYELSNY